MLEGHDFKPGLRELTGGTSPWNTLALWSVKRLGVTGFVTVSDGLGDKSIAGIEEVAAIALHQHIRGGVKGAMAKVVKLEVGWDVDWADPERQKWHEEKMRGKVRRAQLQLQELGLPTAYVMHVG